MTTEEIKPLVSPWVPESSPRDLKVLGKALEEGGEYVAAVARCLIQGINEAEPVTGKPNRLWIAEEMADVYATMYLVVKRFGLDGEFIANRCEKKIAQLRTWHEMGAE